MRFDPPLKQGTLLRRYKRFLADVDTVDDGPVTMHCANTGAMKGCSTPGSEAWYSVRESPKRKYSCSLELVADGKDLVCVNTARANQVVDEGLRRETPFDILPAPPFRREIPIPGGRGRFDFGNERTVIEVKSVTYRDNCRGLFPDAVSDRATRHVVELQSCAERGVQAVLLFCVMHTGISSVSPADDIDPRYGSALRSAVNSGVHVLAWSCEINPNRLQLTGALPVEL